MRRTAGVAVYRLTRIKNRPDGSHHHIVRPQRSLHFQPSLMPTKFLSGSHITGDVLRRVAIHYDQVRVRTRCDDTEFAFLIELMVAATPVALCSCPLGSASLARKAPLCAPVADACVAEQIENRTMPAAFGNRDRPAFPHPSRDPVCAGISSPKPNVCLFAVNGVGCQRRHKKTRRAASSLSPRLRPNRLCAFDGAHAALHRAGDRNAASRHAPSRRYSQPWFPHADGGQFLQRILGAVNRIGRLATPPPAMILIWLAPWRSFARTARRTSGTPSASAGNSPTPAQVQMNFDATRPDVGMPAGL